MGYSPRGHKESDTTDQLTLSLYPPHLVFSDVFLEHKKQNKARAVSDGIRHTGRLSEEIS